jgi:hypothetical protein
MHVCFCRQEAAAADVCIALLCISKTCVEARMYCYSTHWALHCCCAVQPQPGSSLRLLLLRIKCMKTCLAVGRNPRVGVAELLPVTVV